MNENEKTPNNIQIKNEKPKMILLLFGELSSLFIFLVLKVPVSCVALISWALDFFLHDFYSFSFFFVSKKCAQMNFVTKMYKQIHYQRSRNIVSHTLYPNENMTRSKERKKWKRNKKEKNPIHHVCSFSFFKWSKHQRNACCAKEWYRIHNFYTTENLWNEMKNKK